MAHFESVVRNFNGQALPNSTVSVFLKDTQTLANLFSDEDLSVEIANPVTADSLGNVEFYVPGGTYDLLVERFDVKERLFENVEIIPADTLKVAIPAANFITGDSSLYALTDNNPVVTLPADGTTTEIMAAARLPSEFVGGGKTLKATVYFNVVTGPEQVRLATDLELLSDPNPSWESFVKVVSNEPGVLNPEEVEGGAVVVAGLEGMAVFRLRREAGHVDDDNSEDIQFYFAVIEAL